MYPVGTIHWIRAANLNLSSQSWPYPQTRRPGAPWAKKKPKRQPYTQRFAWKFQVEMYGQGCRTLGIWFGKLGQELRIKKTSAMMLHAVEHCSMSSAPNLAVKFISVTFGNSNAKFEFSNLSCFQLGSTKQSNSTAEIGRQGPAV